MKPLLYDVFCGAGGCTRGYQEAGFRVIGIDVHPQKHYVGDGFLQMDWAEFFARYATGELEKADAIHCSPPCQAYSALKHMTTKQHAQLIEPVRAALIATGLPYVIENVPGAPLIEPLMLCGSMFGLQTTCGAQLRRHRLFESNVFLMSPGECRHGEVQISVQGHQAYNEAERMRIRRGGVISVHGDKARDRRRTISITGDHPADITVRKANSAARVISVHGDHPRDESIRWDRRVVTVTGSTPQRNIGHNAATETFCVVEARIAMGIEWPMPMSGLSQAIPPPFTKWIGEQILDALR